MPEPPLLASFTKQQSWCLAHAVDPVNCPVHPVLEFLQEKLAAGAAATTLRVYVTAIAAHRELYEIPLGRHRMVSAFMHGVRRLRPVRPIGVPFWDLSVVLEGLMAALFEPLESAPEWILTLKVTLLLALTSLKRVGDLPVDTIQVFRKNAEHLMCDLTTGWILESAQSLSVCTYHNMDLTTFYDSSGERRTTHSSEWEGTQTLRRERHAHRWPSMVRGAVLARPTRSSGKRRTHSSEWEGTQTSRRERHAHRWPSTVRGAMLAWPTRRATYHRALGSRELIPQNERELRHSEGCGMLIGDPLWWGEQC